MLRTINRDEFSDEIIDSWVGNGASTLVKRALSGSEIVDENKLIKVLIKKIKKSKKGLIIDSIFSHLIPKKHVDLCIVTTCEIGVLRDRLKKRKYSPEKVKENVEIEIFDSFVIEAKGKKHNLIIVNTTEGYKLKEITDFIKSF